MTTYVVLAVIVAVFFWAVAVYNRLIKNRQLVQEGWSGIDVQLKRRSNLIPNLVETVKGYMKHEKETLTQVTEMRARAEKTGAAGTIAERSQAEGALSGALARLFAVAEKYPDLKANQNFIDLQRQLVEVEEQIQLARRYYNGTVRNLNVLVQSFPSNVIANTFKFSTAEYFELEDAAERAVPKVEF